MSTEETTESRNRTDEERARLLEELMHSEPLPMIRKSITAFRRDLPELLETHAGQWVGYHGEECFGVGRTQTELYQKGFRRGLTRDEFIVGFVEPGAFDPIEDVEVTYWDV